MSESPIHDSFRSAIPRRPSPETLAWDQGFQDNRAFCNIVHRANALRSTGPRTAEGKEQSRRNGLKHGLTGAGIVLPDEDVAGIDRRFEEFQEELNPAGGVGRFLVRRAAMLSVRLDRCVRHEAAATGSRIRGAGADFGRERLAEVDHAMSWIGAEPATHVRKLRTMPEGVARPIAALLELRAELDDQGAARWDWTYGMRLADLTGSRWMDIPATPIRSLSEAVGGDFRHLLAGEGGGLGDLERRIWARDQLVERIDVEVAALRSLREQLDPEAIEVERAGAGARALFDPSKEAILARKYEAAAERGFFRTLRELKELEAAPASEAAPCPPADPFPPERDDPGADPESDPLGESLGSFFPHALDSPRMPGPSDRVGGDPRAGLGDRR